MNVWGEPEGKAKDTQKLSVLDPGEAGTVNPSVSFLLLRDTDVPWPAHLNTLSFSP